MTKKSVIGKLGEDIACKYLKKNGFYIIERNFLRKWGELDVIAKYKDGTLVFVEVKTMMPNENLRPEDNLTRSKLEKLKRTASLYANGNPKLINDKKGWRIDLLAIALKNDESYEIRHFENI